MLEGEWAAPVYLIAGLCSGSGKAFQIINDGLARAFIKAPKHHIGAGQETIRAGKKGVQGLTVPHQVGAFKRRRIIEVFNRAGRVPGYGSQYTVRETTADPGCDQRRYCPG